jgi:O-6-methylguanine DNA methyltransferase
MKFSIKILSHAELKQHLQSTPSFTGLLKIPSGSTLKMLYTAQGVYRTDFIAEDNAELSTIPFLTENDIHTLLLVGTPFQQKVWQAALHIPTGQVISYQGLARMINHPAASRAVGTALGANPLIYFVPCHRIVRSDGSLGGFGAGLPLKKALLEAETLCSKK